MLPNSYARMYQRQAVLTASPGQLVLMLYDGALRFLSLAHVAMETDASDWSRFETINRNIQKAQNIIAELKGTLNHENGRDIAPLLDRLYDYYNRRLHEANFKKDLAPLIEVEHLLGDLRDGWEQMLHRREDADDPNMGRIRNIA